MFGGECFWLAISDKLTMLTVYRGVSLMLVLMYVRAERVQRMRFGVIVVIARELGGKGC